MALWDKVRQELDRAGKAAQGALDEGKIRLEAFRARQLADKAAQALGYAVYRARAAGVELQPDSLERLCDTLGAREAEAARYEEQLRAATERREAGAAGPDSNYTSSPYPPAEPPPPASPPPAADPHQPL
jgi:hypothetical protein